MVELEVSGAYLSKGVDEKGEAFVDIGSRPYDSDPLALTRDEVIDLFLAIMKMFKEKI